jgi:hypothetical protein
MNFPRLSRFKRASTFAPIQLTERDRNIIWWVHRHRFLRSRQIMALLGETSQQVLRRLQLLYHHGYLERPKAQLDYYHQGGTRHIIYGLGNKGGAFMRGKLGIARRKLSWGEKNRAIRGMFLEHAILVSDVMVALELACRETRHIRLLMEDGLLMGKKRQPFQWQVRMSRGPSLGVIPDRFFALEFQDQNGGSQRVYYFLEADRGTMPVTRRTLSQTSFYRKLIAYEATWFQSIHRTKLGLNRFRVLTVTTSAARLQSLLDTCSRLKRGHGLFLFADRSILEKPSDIFSPIWKSGRQGEIASLLS